MIVYKKRKTDCFLVYFAFFLFVRLYRLGKIYRIKTSFGKEFVG